MPTTSGYRRLSRDRMPRTDGLSRVPASMLRATLAQRQPDPTTQLDETDWRAWNAAIVPDITNKPYGPHHIEFWEWADSIRSGTIHQPLACLWPRGHAKSAGAEIAAVKWGCLGHRMYGLYVSATQDLADKHVDSIAEILESGEIAKHYPAMGEKRVGKFGNSKGWRRNRLTTEAGFTVDALGLEVAPRGLKTLGKRPDFIILDDIDDQDDTIATVEKKIRRITQGIIQAGTDEVVVLMAQNLVHKDAIAAQMVDGRTDLLANAKRIGPFPAVENLQYETQAPTPEDPRRYVITGGTPTWEGMPLEGCEARINGSGPTAFIIESQQQISERKGALWTRALIDKYRVGTYPELVRVGVGVDPNKTGRGDDAGVIVAGVGYVGGDRHAFVLADATQLTNPEKWRDEAAELYLAWQAALFVVERTGLGEHATLTLKDAPALQGIPVTVEPVEAKLSKEDRSRPVAQLYADGRVHHVGHFPIVEGQMTSWVPGKGKSPGGVDALTHLLTRLLIDDAVGDAWSELDDILGPGGMGQVPW